MKLNIPIGQSFKLILRPLNKDLVPRKSNCDLTYMASFWKENQLVKTKKKA